MDEQLRAVIERLNDQNAVLDIVRTKYLEAEACRKHNEARMVSMAIGKSHAERLIHAQATESWKHQSVVIAKLEANYEFEKLKFQVLEKEWQSLYLSLKIDTDTIRKQR